MISVRKSILEEIEKRRISAILRAEDRKVAADAMRAAIAGGFRMVEFTLTTPGALELISAFSAQYPDLIVGAGTVMTTQMATDAAHSGARFLVSPICDPEMITAAKQLDVVAIPGAFTPTEMIRAHLCGADLVKLFPAAADVARYITSVLGPFPYMKIFPTAGVNLENMLDVLNAGAAGVGFVRSLFYPSDLESKNFTAIEARATAINRRLRQKA